MKTLRTIIAPSILSCDFANLQHDCETMVKLGADSLHVDIMDGHFVNNLTIGPPIVSCLRKKMPDVHLDCHLMVTDPEKYLEPLAKAKINCFTFHYEANYSNLKGFLQKIREHNIEASVSIKPKTPLPDDLVELAREGLLDKILIMSVEPGFGGQGFIKEVLPKVKELREKVPNLNIQVDGGITDETIKLVSSYGANHFVAGSFLFNATDRGHAMNTLRNLANENFNSSFK